MNRNRKPEYRPELLVVTSTVPSSGTTSCPMKAGFLIACILLVMSLNAQAEHGCQDGFIPVNQGNGQNCVADYNLPYWDNADETSDAHSSGPHFAERWGAIAIDDQARNGGFGAVASMHTKRKAEKAAISKCRESGAGSCAVKLSYYNQCASVAWGDTGYNAVRAATSEEAEARAIRGCGAKHANCKIFYSACSLPEQIQ